MALAASFANELLLGIFNAADIGGSDADGLFDAGVLANIYLSLHTASPNAGDQATSEANYTGYARIAVPRDNTNWTVTANAVTNALAQAFAVCTAGTNTITHVGIGTDSSGAGLLLYSSALSASIAVSLGKIPSIAIGAISVTHSTS